VYSYSKLAKLLEFTVRMILPKELNRHFEDLLGDIRMLENCDWDVDLALKKLHDGGFLGDDYLTKKQFNKRSFSKAITDDPKGAEYEYAVLFESELS